MLGGVIWLSTMDLIRQRSKTSTIGLLALNQKVWNDKPMLLLSTSPGPRGGATVMEAAKATFPRMGAKLVAHFSLPSFYDHFNSGIGINDAELKRKFDEVLINLDQ
jgi:NAD(P)H-dependent FMN reductase